MDIYQIVTDKIIEKLESGTVPWKCPWRQDGTLPMNLASKKAYRGINLCLLPEHYSSPYFVSFKQAHDFGGHVKAGESGHMVVFWKFFDKVAENGEPTGDSVPMLRYYKVWNVEQTTIDASRLPATAPMNDVPPIERADKVLAGMPKRPEIREGEARAYYSPSGDFVNMPKRGLFDGPESYYGVLFHELTHATGHESRLNRKQGKWTGFGSSEYSKEELVAEMGSAYLCGYTGIASRVDASASYIASWLRVLRNDKKMVVLAAGQAQKASNYILGMA